MRRTSIFLIDGRLPPTGSIIASCSSKNLQMHENKRRIRKNRTFDKHSVCPTSRSASTSLLSRKSLRFTHNTFHIQRAMPLFFELHRSCSTLLYLEQPACSLLSQFVHRLHDTKNQYTATSLHIENVPLWVLSQHGEEIHRV